MRKLITLFTLIFAFFAFDAVEAQAQNCPEGYNHVTFTRQYSSNCVKEFSFCYKCNGFGPTGDGGTVKQLQITELYPPGNCSQENQQDVAEWEVEQIRDKYMELCSIPDCSSPDAPIEWTIEMPLCRRKIEYSSDPLIILEEYCPYQAHCIEVYEVCYDQSTGEYNFNLISTNEVGNPCPQQNEPEEWQGTYSPCWQYYDDCSDLP